MKNHTIKFIALTALAIATAFPAAAEQTPKSQSVSSAICQETTSKHALLNALLKNDVGRVDKLLKSGEYEVNEVICTYAKSDPLLFGGAEKIRLTSLEWKPMTDVCQDPDVVFFGGYTGNYAPYETPTPAYYLYGTPLMVAAQKGSVEMLRLLLKRGANPNRVVKIGTYTSPTLYTEGYQYLTAVSATACIDSWSTKRESVVKRTLEVLKAAGALPGPRDGRGRTCLLDAVQYRSVPLFEFCVEYGLNPNEPDHGGKTVFNHCLEAARNPYDYSGSRTWTAFLRKIAAYQRGSLDEEDDEEEEQETAIRPDAFKFVPFRL